MELSDLPMDVLVTIACELEVGDVCALMETSQALYRLLIASELWRRLYLSNYSSPDVFGKPEAPPSHLHGGDEWLSSFQTRFDVERSFQKAKYFHRFFRTADRIRVGTMQLDTDEGILATGETNGRLVIYDISTAMTDRDLRPLFKLPCHEDAVRSLQFDSRIIVTGSRDQFIKVWDKCPQLLDEIRDQKRPLDKVKPLLSLNCGQNCNSLTFQGSRLIAGFSNGSLRHLDLETLRELNSIQGHKSWVRHLQLEGDLLVSAGADSHIHGWDTRAFTRPAFTLNDHTDVVTAVHFFDNVAYSGSYDKSVLEWDLRRLTPRSTRNYNEGTVRSLQADKHKIVTGNGAFRVSIFDLNKDRHITLFPFRGFVSSVRFSKDLLATATADSSIQLFWFSPQGRGSLDPLDPRSATEYYAANDVA